MGNYLAQGHKNLPFIFVSWFEKLSVHRNTPCFLDPVFLEFNVNNVLFARKPYQCGARWSFFKLAHVNPGSWVSFHFIFLEDSASRARQVI